MEERKLDPYQLIGFILIALIMTWMLMNQPPVEETVVENEPSIEKVETQPPTRLAIHLFGFKTKRITDRLQHSFRQEQKKLMC